MVSRTRRSCSITERSEERKIERNTSQRFLPFFLFYSVILSGSISNFNHFFSYFELPLTSLISFILTYSHLLHPVWQCFFARLSKSSIRRRIAVEKHRLIGRPQRRPRWQEKRRVEVRRGEGRGRETERGVRYRRGGI